MSEGYYIIAHVVNAIDYAQAEVELEVAYKSTDDIWYTNDGRQVWPFWEQPIEFPTPAIPEGWIEHLHELANKMFSAVPRASLAERLGLNKPKPLPPLVRRL